MTPTHLLAPIAALLLLLSAATWLGSADDGPAWTPGQVDAAGDGGPF